MLSGDFSSASGRMTSLTAPRRAGLWSGRRARAFNVALGPDGRLQQGERRPLVEALLPGADLGIGVLGLVLVALDDGQRARLAPAVGRGALGLRRVARAERLDDGGKRGRGRGVRGGGAGRGGRRRTRAAPRRRGN